MKAKIARIVRPLLTPERLYRVRTLMYVRDMLKNPEHAPFARECNACGHTGYFRPFGWPLRVDAWCPSCGSLERHRLLLLWASQREPFTNRDVLHFAAEPIVRAFVRPLAATYVTAGLDKDDADRVINIEQIDMPDASFDVVICSHVLEHVDDGKALAELYRTLRPGGLAVLMFPVVEGWATTFENDAVHTPRERLAAFGQSDHVRIFGADVRSRITAAGFTLEEFTAVEPHVSRFALQRGEKLFIAAKPAPPSPA